MGEYAKYKNSEIKIGTCEDMYITFDDIKHVTGFNFDNGKFFFLLPHPEFDNKHPYDYKAPSIAIDESAPIFKEITEEPGNVQLSSSAGLLANVKCFHGVHLPENSESAKFFWNGKGQHLELVQLKVTFKNGKLTEIRPVVACNQCRKMWSYTPEEILSLFENDRREVIKRIKDLFELVKRVNKPSAKKTDKKKIKNDSKTTPINTSLDIIQDLKNWRDANILNS